MEIQQDPARDSATSRAVELFPYHSVDSSSLKVGWQKMPSAVRARGYLSDISEDRKKLKLIMRSRDSWLADLDYKKSGNFPEVSKSRGISFNHELGGKAAIAGRSILEMLRENC